jgi:hypothetical protein
MKTAIQQKYYNEHFEESKIFFASEQSKSIRPNRIRGQSKITRDRIHHRFAKPGQVFC